MKNKNAVYLMGGIVILVLSILSGYFFGNMILKPNPIVSSNPENALEETNQDQLGQDEMGTDEYSENVMEYDSQDPEAVSGSMYEYSNEELGFSLSLPENFNVLVAEARQYETSAPIEFYLPVESPDGQEPSQALLFSIVKFSPDEDVTQAGPDGSLILATEDGYQYYFFPSFDSSITPEQPEYEIYQSLINEDIFSIVQSGFQLL